MALRLASPTPNMTSISDQQQPTQNAPWAMPIAQRLGAGRTCRASD